MKFSALGLNEATMKGLAEARFTDCTPVQELVLPYSLAGKDVMVQSKTGSGKTAVYLLTIIEKYMKAHLSRTNLPVALVVAPTRELAIQIEEDAQLLSRHVPDFRVGCFYGGVGYGQQTEELKEGLSLYVGTPGRLIDFARSHKIDFRMFSTVVLDEADRMFDMGFYPDVQKMFSMMVRPTERQTIILSATLSTKVRNLAWDYMNEPLELESQPEEITVDKITQELFHVTRDEEFQLLLQLLKKLSPKSVLIFTNTKDRAVEVSDRLKLNGYRSAYLMGDMKQSERLKALDRLKNGELTILVATDVAARGLQIDDLELVVNYDLPEDYENYVHRIGRTARAGKAGRAVSFASEEYVYSLEAIEEYIHMKIPVCWPDEYGLEEVEDRSGDYVKRHRRGSRGDSRRTGDRRSGRRSSGGASRASSSRSSGSRRDDRGADRRDRKSEDKVRVARPRKLSDDEYNRLASMSFEDRMKYYKDEFESSGPAQRSENGAKGASAQKNGGRSQERRRSNADGRRRTQGQTKAGEGQRRAKASGPAPAPKSTPTASVASAPRHVSVEPERKRGFWAKVKSIFTGEDA